MNSLASVPIGRRVAAFRMLRGMTQSGLAARLHRSRSWVGRIERGERRIDSMAVLDKLSRALGLPVYELAGQHDPALGVDRGCGSADLAALRRALDRPAMASPGGAAPRSVAELQSDAVALRRRYHGSMRTFSAVLPSLGDLISQAQYAAFTVAARDRPRAHAVLAELYRLASTGLRQLGDRIRARVAIDRALSAAEQADDMLRVGAAATFLTVQLGIQGDATDAVAVAMDVADLVARDPRAATPAGTVVWGALHHYAAIPAGRTGDAREVRRMLETASHAAETLGGREHEAYGMFLGPMNLVTQEVYALVELGRPREALRRAEWARPDELGSVVRSGIHHVGVARAYSMCRQDDGAITALATGMRIAPGVVGNDMWAREIVWDLLHRRPYADEELRRVARAMNLAG